MKYKNELLKIYNNQCANCGSTKKLTIDHKVPRYWQGGKNKKTDNIQNLQILCKKCNDRKGNYYGFYECDFIPTLVEIIPL